jgi:hypothetical protein
MYSSVSITAWLAYPPRLRSQSTIHPHHWATSVYPWLSRKTPHWPWTTTSLSPNTPHWWTTSLLTPTASSYLSINPEWEGGPQATSLTYIPISHPINSPRRPATSVIYLYHLSSPPPLSAATYPPDHASDPPIVRPCPAMQPATMLPVLQPQEQQNCGFPAGPIHTGRCMLALFNADRPTWCNHRWNRVAFSEETKKPEKLFVVDEWVSDTLCFAPSVNPYLAIRNFTLR